MACWQLWSPCRLYYVQYVPILIRTSIWREYHCYLMVTDTHYNADIGSNSSWWTDGWIMQMTITRASFPHGGDGHFMVCEYNVTFWYSSGHSQLGPWSVAINWSVCNKNALPIILWHHLAVLLMDTKPELLFSTMSYVIFYLKCPKCGWKKEAITLATDIILVL